jgi:hypothetical protein
MRDTSKRRRRIVVTRRGVVGILAMMFLALFASLAGAMAVVTQGNLRSAASHLRVVRSLGAVDTGMTLAAGRMREAAGRFIVARGEVDGAYVADLWFGPLPGAPEVVVLDPPFGMSEASPPGSLQAAIANIHAADDPANLVGPGSVTNAPQGITTLDRGSDWLVTLPIGIARNVDGLITSATQISYGPPDADGETVVVVTGYDWDPARGRWVTRSASQRFRLAKRVEFAVVSTTPTLIGVGGNVEGPVGSLFDSAALDSIDGAPYRSLSDFYGLDPALDDKLDDFFERVVVYDADGDNRLSEAHAVEVGGVDELNLIDYDGDTSPDLAFLDLTRDGIVDDFDVFLQHFDGDGDGRLVVSAALAAGTTADGRAPEFTINDRLSYLIDSALRDRNDNGRRNGDFVDGAWDWATFEDNSGDGVLDADDVDLDDVVLGYRDGYLDYRDQYAKVRGTVYLRASRTAWESAEDDGVVVADYQAYTQGPIRSEDHEASVVFEASPGELPELTDESFSAATQALIALIEASGADTLQEQAEAQMGAGWVPPTRVEPTPYGASSAADWYQRPVYEGMVFKNVTIPLGTNALFSGCEFIGITRVETYADNTHPSWTFYGQQERDPATGVLTLVYPPPPALSDAALDTSYADPGAPGYDSLPAPLDVPIDLDGDGATPDRVYDTKRLANNIRFHDCLFVGSVVADKPTVYRHVRNKLQFTGATRFMPEHPDAPDDPQLNPDPAHEAEIEKSSIMVPHYSVDIGSINPPPEQDVRLRGAVVAGVMDVRGNAEIRGVVLSSFTPVHGQAPLELYGDPVGNPANFNVTIGTATTEDGDLEAVAPGDLTDVDGDGTPDLGWDSARDETGALVTLAGAGGNMEEWWFDGVPDTAAIDGVHVRRAIAWRPPGMTRIEADPEAVLPDGLALRMSVLSVPGSYSERK